MAELRTHFHLFAYGTLRAGGRATGMLRDCEHVSPGELGGVLYDIDGDFPALVLYGNTPVSGDIWRCPNALLPVLDDYEGIEKGLFRRVGVRVRASVDALEIPCWAYVAGPALSAKLLPARRITHWTD